MVTASTGRASVRAGIDAIKRYVPVFDIPAPRWPLAWHIAIAATTVILFAVGGKELLRLQQQRYVRAQAQLERASRELLLARRAGQTPAAMQASLPAASSAESVTRDLASFASALGVHLSSVRVSYEAAHVSSYARIEFTTASQGSYKDLKAWIAQLLDRYPTLVLAALSLRRGDAGSDRLEAAANFQLFVRASQ